MATTATATAEEAAVAAKFASIPTIFGTLHV